MIVGTCGMSFVYECYVMRADMVLVERKLADSRQKAKELIETGAVTANGHIIKKASQSLSLQADIVIDSPLKNWVSRGALKLLGGLEAFPDISVAGKVAVDLGASTGGFSQVLLAHDVSHVFAVDVGHSQLSDKIAKSPRVTSLEKCNARFLTTAELSLPFQLIVCDVSFISLTLALPPAMALASPGAQMIALIKPQFEVGRQGLDKGGIVKDASLRDEAVQQISDFIREQGWQVIGVTTSPIKGPDGNIEYLIGATKV